MLATVFALVPKILEAMALIDSIKAALNSGKSILEVLQEKGGEFIEFFTEVAKTLFPNLSKEDQAAAGVSMLDIANVKTTQAAMNRFQEAGIVSFGTPLNVDGSYGTLTKAAVTAYQTKRGLDVDGWAGQQTNAMRDVDLAKLNAPVSMESALRTVAAPAVAK